MDTNRNDQQPVPPESLAKTREELDLLLAHLDEAVPQLIAQHPDCVDFMPLFADRADAIARQANATDYEWLLGRVDAVLEKNGKRSGEYLPPHDLLIA